MQQSEISTSSAFPYNFLNLAHFLLWVVQHLWLTALNSSLLMPPLGSWDAAAGMSHAPAVLLEMVGIQLLVDSQQLENIPPPSPATQNKA